MEQDTGDAPVRVSLEGARASAKRFRKALRALGLQDAEIGLILPVPDINDDGHVRMGTWDPPAVDKLSAAIEATAPRPRLIGSVDAPPLLPAES